MSAKETSFSAGERVLCYHGPLIYEAKILKTENWDGANTKNGETGVHYFVHYRGWKQTWDEWVPPSRLLKLTPENQAIAKRLSEERAPATKPPTKEKASASKDKDKDKDKDAATAATASGTTAGRRKEVGTTSRKRGRDEYDTGRKPEMKLDVPDVLKVVLVDDWEAVTKNNQLVTLPRDPTVKDVLTEFGEYLEQMEKKLPSFEIVFPTFVSGLQLYFERSLGTNLLYRFERQQYADIRHNYYTGQHVVRGQEPTINEIYGCEHLLRMLVNMPGMIAQTTMDPESVALLREYLVELMKFMIQNKDRFFLKQYENATSHYLSLMRA